MWKIKLFVFLDIFKRKLIRTQEPNISFSFEVIVALSIFDEIHICIPRIVIFCEELVNF
ncbi:peptide deformylase [Rickettsia sp. TH2014]|uniref:peptide deformylase n=1 Tax=Rickettsia sp. TH2014 TaxID=1967503 RepID=UPI001C4764F8|nr:peptide deformylase [Rickettsia sp. TH2014]